MDLVLILDFALGNLSVLLCVILFRQTLTQNCIHLGDVRLTVCSIDSGGRYELKFIAFTFTSCSSLGKLSKSLKFLFL